jgi:phage internal scaffolding protein
MKFRSHFDYDVEAASNEAAIPADGHGQSLTIQSQSEDADINVMVRRFGITGVIPAGVRVPSYGDFTGVGDYRSALHAVMEAQENFMQLPAPVRARFDNDPQLLLDFASVPENIPALVKMGLGKEISNVGVSSGVVEGTGSQAGSSAGVRTVDGKPA